MPRTIFLDGFPAGLDARKFSLSAPPGTLTELSNGHLTNGGEIEKRKAFVPTYNVAITETGATATAGIRTFGIQETAVGLTVFGSALAFGSGVTLSQPVLASAVPAGVTYQQLKHPAVTDGETYVAATHAMTAATNSTTFAGLIYVLATFSDGKTYGYYDGVLDRDFTDGLIMAHLNTNTKIATAIKELVNRSSDYTATNPSATVAQITGPLGSPYETTVTDESSLGVLTGTKVSDPTNAIAARKAIGSFTVIAGSGTANGSTIATTNRARTSNVATLTTLAHSIPLGAKITVTGLGGTGYNLSNVVVTAVTATTLSYASTGSNEGTTADTGGTITVQNQIVSVEVNSVVITNGTELWITSNEVTATNLALSINSKASTPEYTAEAQGAVVTIKALDADGDSPNDYVVKTTCAGDVCIGKVQFQVQVTAGGFTVSQINVNGVDIKTGALSGGYAYSGYGSTFAFATAIAGDINAGTFKGATHGFVANAAGAVISISRAVTQSSDAYVPTFFVMTGTSIGNGIFEIGTGTGPVSGLSAILIVTGSATSGGGGNMRTTYFLSLSISGGLAPYLAPVWFGTTIYPVLQVSGNSYSVQTYFGQQPPHVYAVVTDSLGNTGQSNTL